MPYDRNKAAAYNKLIQQGVSEDEALNQAGIGDADSGDYSIGMNGQLGPLVVGTGTKNNVEVVKGEPPRSTYAQTPARQVTAVTTTRSKTESTETVSGGGTTTIIAGQPKSNANSEAAAVATAAKQAELDQYIKDNPSNFARKRQGLPPLTPEENEAREAKRRELEDQVSQASNTENNLKTPGTPTVINTPNTTTTQHTTVYQTSVEKKPVQYVNDPELERVEEEELDNEPDDATEEDALEPRAVDPEDDQGLQTLNEDNENVESFDAEPVDSNDYEELQEPPGTEQEFTELAEPVDPDSDPELLGGPDEEEVGYEPLREPGEVDPESDPELLGGPEEGGEPELLGGPDEEDSFQGAQEAAVKERAKQQATFQARYKQAGNSDWRVRLSLSPNAQYLYNAGTPRGSGAGILAPLAKTDGVIFPYTPNINTTYSANYEQYDLVHSNYRGVFYKNSRVGDINIRGTFTAQDTNEANYLLAVIHFFRSATKMFYGQDAERGTPPPVCLLNGLGAYQFSDHPVVISSFNYTTPNDVDYIRAVDPNNYGSNLLNRRAAVASNPGGASLAGLNRLLNAVQNGLSKGAIPNVPAPGTVNQNISNTTRATYVPTKIEVDITLIPVQTRSQVSKQFSLKGFANGDLLKGGFW